MNPSKSQTSTQAPMTKLEAALHYAAKGWPVFPLKPNTKIPYEGSHGFKDATTDIAQITEWWTQFPDSNIGVATGQAFVVLDVDPRHGGDETLRELERQYELLPETPMSLTGGGGVHYLFACPDRREIRCSVGTLGPGLDVRTDGGYIVVPPSIHPNGTAYAWDAAHHPDDVPLALVSQWLIEKLTTRPEQGTALKSSETIPDGQRNDSLTSLGGGMRRQGATETEIFAALTVFNASRCRPPLPEDEVRRIAQSLTRYPVVDEPLRLTDVANAERFAQQHQQTIRYCYGLKTWLLWDGQRWKPDSGQRVMGLAKQTARHLYELAAQEPDESRRKALAKWASESESERRLKSMVSLAQSEPGIAIEGDTLDADPLLLNLLNGTLDLRTGELRAARRDDFITKLVPVAYSPVAVCPEFERLLNRLFEHGPAVREYLQRIFGYSLTGLTHEQCFFIFFGVGANGKSTILRTILDLLGDYATTTRPETFLTKRGDGIPNDVAALAGARFVVALESEQGKRLAEALVKGVTGGDKLSARFLHKEFFTFAPQFKFFIGTNHKPTIKSTDHAMWRRVRCLLFGVVIPDHEQDKRLSEKLRAEYAGILNWLIQGCLAWQRNGLGPPLEVQAATAAYRAEQDVLGVFLKDRCVLEPTAKSVKKELYEKYVVWCDESGERDQLPMREFTKMLREQGMVDAKVGNAKGCIGLRLRTPLDAEPDEGELVGAQPEVIHDEN